MGTPVVAAAGRLIPVLATFVDTATPIGAGGLLALLFGYLFRELHRKDDGVWQIIADRDKTHAAALAAKDAEIARLVKDRDFWRYRRLDQEEDAHRQIMTDREASWTADDAGRADRKAGDERKADEERGGG